ncbi:hypothetical protein MMC22_001147 [Lobaria immixta]|nr:hypothetical protein [Lobaria immixta]
MSQGFSDAALRYYEPTILAKIEQLCSALLGPKDGKAKDVGDVKRDGWSAPQNMSRWFDYLTFDIMTSIAFSASFNALGSDEYRYVVRAIEDSNVRLGVLMQAPEVASKKLDLKLFPKAIEARTKFVGFVKKVLSARLKSSGAVYTDIFSFVQSAKDPETGNRLGLKELSTEMATLIVAGSDTTSTALAGAMFYLSQNPAAYARVTEEVRGCFSSLNDIRTGPRLNSLTYLRACIDETLRLSPPGGGPFWRQVQHGGAWIDGLFIPAGYDVGCGVYALHHHPAYHPQPFKYDASRWHKPDRAAAAPDPRMAYMPFSIGPRGCVGKSLAFLELMLTMAVILWRFDFQDEDADVGVDLGEEMGGEKGGGDGKAEKDEKRTASGNRDMRSANEFKLLDHVSGAKDGPMLQFRLRKSE